MNSKIIDFLIKSRKNTYASGADSLLVNGGKTFVIKKGNLEYRDTYFDQDRYFQGQEILFQNEKPVWSMSYRGAAEEGVNTGEVFEALQKFIKEHANRVRLGENFETTEGDYGYKCIASGDIDEFKGREEIYQSGQLAHWMDYFGGKIE